MSDSFWIDDGKPEMTMHTPPVPRRRIAPGALRAGLLAGVALILAGCYVPRETVSIPNDYRKRHPIQIKEGERTVEILIGDRRGALTAAQRADVLAFAQRWRRESTGGIVIEVPAGSSNQVAASEAMREAHSLIAASGIPANVVRTQTYHPDPGRLATVKMSYSKMVAEAGPCGLWPHDLGPSWDPSYQENRTYWNLGCANQRNLAAMVDNPSDLVQPRGEGGISQARRTFVMERYRRGEPTATRVENPDKGKLSDVGK
jgi:pilus assembly protein CpaD